MITAGDFIRALKAALPLEQRTQAAPCDDPGRRDQ